MVTVVIMDLSYMVIGRLSVLNLLGYTLTYCQRLIKIFHLKIANLVCKIVRKKLHEFHYSRNLHLPAVYTLETSFFDTIDGISFTPDILKNIGRDICRALIPYCGLNDKFTINIKNKKNQLSKKQK